MTDALTIDPAATLWSTEDRAGKPLLVMLHGYGADEHDLFGLVPYLPQGIAVASLAAPLDAPYPAPGRSWFPLGLLGQDPGVADAPAEALLRWLDAEAGDAPSVTLLGFSQGAVVSLQALRLAPERFDGVLVLSSVVAPGEMLGDAQLRELRPPVFWGMGSADGMFPAALVQNTGRWLPEHSTLTSRVYPGLGHGISQEELLDIRKFLESWVASASV